MRAKAFLLSLLACGLFVGQASALEYTVDAPNDYLFGRPTSMEEVHTEAEPVNADRSKSVALIPPGFGTPTSYLPSSGEYLTPNLVPGALSGGLVPQLGEINYPAVDAGASYTPTQTVTFQPITRTAFTSVTSDLFYSGGYLGTLKIPRLGVNVKVYEGTGSAELAKGAGHFTDTSIDLGNVCIAGHNRGANCYFGDIHTLNTGDRITLTTKLGTRTYSVTSVKKIAETDNSDIGKRAVLEVGGSRVRMKERNKWYIIPDHHPAIVDPATFEQSKAKQLRYPQPVKKPRDYPLKGKIFCGCCNHALSRTFQKTSYYFCRHSDADENLPCHRMRCEASGLEQAVFDTLKAQMDVLLSEDGAVSPAKIVTERPAYECQIEALGDEKMRLYESYQLGEIELSVYKARKEILDAELLKAKNAYAALTAQVKRDQEAQVREAERRSISKELSVASGLTTELTGLLIDKVYVFPDKRIEIAYKVRDIFQ